MFPEVSGECSRKCPGRAGWGRTTGYLGPFGPVLESQPVFEKNRKSGPSFLLEILILFILSAHSWALPAARALGFHRATSLMAHCSQGWCCCHVYTKEMRRRVIKWPVSQFGVVSSLLRSGLSLLEGREGQNAVSSP